MSDSTNTNLWSEDDGRWHDVAVCPCGERHHASFGDLWFVKDPCSECGGGKYQMEIRRQRWVSETEFWHVTTWWTGHWEDRTERRKLKEDKSKLNEAAVKAGNQYPDGLAIDRGRVVLEE